MVDNLIFDLLEWISMRDRSYEEVIGAWRTSCPKLPVWEEANDRGFVMKEDVNGLSFVKVSPLGLDFLERHKASEAERLPRTADAIQPSRHEMN